MRDACRGARRATRSGWDRVVARSSGGSVKAALQYVKHTCRRQESRRRYYSVRVPRSAIPKMPKPSEDAKAAFSKLVPAEPAVTMRPMFGNLAAFVNGNMFAGLFGEDLFVRLADDHSASVRRQGGRDLEPMPGRAMSGYVTVPSSWRSKPEGAKAWIKIALEQTRQ